MHSLLSMKIAHRSACGGMTRTEVLAWHCKNIAYHPAKNWEVMSFILAREVIINQPEVDFADCSLTAHRCSTQLALIQLNLGLVRCCFLNSAHCRVEEVRLDKLDRRLQHYWSWCACCTSRYWSLWCCGRGSVFSIHSIQKLPCMLKARWRGSREMQQSRTDRRRRGSLGYARLVWLEISAKHIVSDRI